MHDQCLLPTNNRVPYFASLSRLFSLFDLLKDKSASWQPRGASRHSTTLVRPDSVLFAERTEEQILLSRRTGFRAGPRVAALGRCLPRADLDQVLPTSSSIADHAAFVLCERERESTYLFTKHRYHHVFFVRILCGFSPRYCDRFDSEGQIDRCLLSWRIVS